MRVKFLAWLIRMLLMLTATLLTTCVGVALKTHGSVVLNFYVMIVAVLFFVGSYAIVTFEQLWIKRRLINFLLGYPIGPASPAGSLAQTVWPRSSNPDIELTKFYREVITRFDESMQDSTGDTARMLFVFVTPSVADQLRTLVAARNISTVSRSKNVSSAP